MAVPVEIDGGTFAPGNPARILSRPYALQGPLGRHYDVSRDGRRFLVLADASADRQIGVVLNWFEELKRLVPAGRN
jgi:hypothetical protein